MTAIDWFKPTSVENNNTGKDPNTNEIDFEIDFDTTKMNDQQQIARSH